MNRYEFIGAVHTVLEKYITPVKSSLNENTIEFAVGKKSKLKLVFEVNHLNSERRVNDFLMECENFGLIIKKWWV